MVMMNFDQRSQTFTKLDECVAGASESIFVTIGSLMAYEEMNLNLNKIILTLGFYVDEYSCVAYLQNWICIIEPFSYRESNCSSRVANQIPWNQFKKQMDHFKQDLQMTYDEHTDQNIFTRLQDDGLIRQYWGDQTSMVKRFDLVRIKKLKGFGIWMVNYLDEKLWNFFPTKLHQSSLNITAKNQI
ncbi:Di-N-acetylchitobiase [Sarcoptes scabiei]|nr:Di-N-acetylchitobiase [Sarcoptes scabiei]